MNAKRESRMAAIIDSQKTIMHAMMGSSAVEWLQLDLTMGQVKALFALDSAGAMPVGRLAEVLRIGLPAASIVADKLVQLDLAVRRDDPGDRRRTFVELTPKGEQLVDRLHQGRDERLRALLAELSEADFAALVQGLQALARVATEEHSKVQTS
jgi:DNA-binding MarR family transcriptional regulator